MTRLLQDCHCARAVLIQPDDRKNGRPTGATRPPGANACGPNRDRLPRGKPVRGLRQIELKSPADQENRRLTTLRKEAGVARARLIHKVKWVL